MPHPSLQSQVVVNRFAAENPAGQTTAQAPVRMVNSRMFELDYQVESGTQSPARVELWGTRDQGRTWACFGTDQDGRSPMRVTANEEGLYGFRVVVADAYGTVTDPPQNGSPPDVWIGVDLTRPDTRLVSVDMGQSAGQIIIRWLAADTWLAAKPITLAYRDPAGGGWIPIAANLENSGQYTWAVGSHVPPRVLLRLEARDTAGNVGVDETPQSLSISPSRAKAHIRDIRPLGEASAS
jgi:hypothetical protein